jgi:type I restriction enzyme, S subunit
MAGDFAPETRTGGRKATTGVIRGRYALSVGRPDDVAPQRWQWTPLSEVARLESGHTPSRAKAEYWDGGIPWIGIRDATENHGRTIYATKQTVTQAGIDNSSARLLPAGTVCLSRTASVGYVVVMGCPMATSQDFVNWVCSDAIDHRFLKYVLLAEHDSMLRFASCTTHQTIYYPEAKAFYVCLPTKEEQVQVADILTSLDDKIELNRRMNETLEAIAQALFKSWFVDFDPVRAKAEGRDPDLPSHIADFFPDALVGSELGPIPAGWHKDTRRGHHLPEQRYFSGVCRRRWCSCIEPKNVSEMVVLMPVRGDDTTLQKDASRGERFSKVMC